MSDKITLIVRFKLQETAKAELAGQLKELFDQIERKELGRSTMRLTNRDLSASSMSDSAIYR